MLGLSTSGTESVASVVAAWLAGVAAATVMFVLNRNSPCRPNHTIAVLRRAFTQITALSLAIALLNVPSLYAALMGGALMGIGMLMLFRHRTSLGGINILALYLQDKHGLRAGYVQLGIDGVILLVALTQLPLDRVGYSVLGALMLNLIIALNHKPGRYIGVS